MNFFPPNAVVVYFIFMVNAISTLAIYEEFCFTPCDNNFSGDEAVPGSDCGLFHNCFQGEVKNVLGCGAGLKFDNQKGYCDFAYNVVCVEPSCPPTISPTTEPPTPYPSVSPTLRPTFPPSVSPTLSPTKRPTGGPTKSPSKSPTLVPTVDPTATPTQSPIGEISIDFLKSKKGLIEEYILVSYTASGVGYPSVRYTFDGLIESLEIMGVQGFGADFQFFLGDSDIYIYGLVNLAALLANAMVESIQYDACDEHNWQEVAGRYALSNSCGQDGRSYQDEGCGSDFTCPVDFSMQMTAVTSGNQVRAPPPMKCEPGSGPGNYAGYWDTSSGSEIKNTPYSNTVGRTDTEGCCWWGRGALLTRNVCNIGKLNYYLGKKAADDGRQSLYPTIDFCEYPEATCASAYSEELRWTTALFEWAERIQRYDKNDWIYEKELTKFLDGGMIDDSFITTVNRIFVHDCHEGDGCSFEVRMANERKANFYLIVNDVFGIKTLLDQRNTPKPTRRPTTQPTKKPTREPTLGPTPKPIFVPSNPTETLPAPPQPAGPTAPNVPSQPFPVSPFPPTPANPTSPSSSEPVQLLPTPQIPFIVQTVPPTNQQLNARPIGLPPTTNSDASNDSTSTPTYLVTLIPLDENAARSNLLDWKNICMLHIGVVLFLLF